MPGVADSRHETAFIKMLRDHERRISALQRNGQMTWSNSQHQRVAQAGLHVEDGTYGHWYFDANTQAPVLKHGQMDDHTFGQWSLDENGNVILKVGQVKIGTTIYYGLGAYSSSGTLIAFLGEGPNGPAFAVYNSSGALESQMGELPDGTYGMAQVARQGVSSGNLVDIGLLASPVVAEVDGLVSTTSTGYQTSDQCAATATIGSSGAAMVTTGGLVYVSDTNSTGNVGLYIDGTLARDGVMTVENNTGGGVGVSGAGFYVATGLSAGSHTFGLRSKTSLSTSAVNVSDWRIVVQPY